MPSSIKVVLGILIVFGSLLVLLVIIGSRQPEAVLVELAIPILQKYLGLILAITSGLLLLGKAVQSGSISATLPLTIPATVGLLILSPHWALGIYLCVLAIGHFTRVILQEKGPAAPPPSRRIPEDESPILENQ